MEDTIPNNYLCTLSDKNLYFQNFIFNREGDDIDSILSNLNNDSQELSELFGNIVSSKQVSNCHVNFNRRINMRGRVLIGNSVFKKNQEVVVGK